MAGDSDQGLDETAAAARELSDGQLKLARLLAERVETGDWRKRHVSFDDYVVKELNTLPGVAKELLRVERKLAALEVEPAAAHDIGWNKLKTVSSKLRKENREEVLLDLETENIQSIRHKYCPRNSNPRHRQTACAPPEPACHERETPPGCCATTAEASQALTSAPSPSPSAPTSATTNQLKGTSGAAAGPGTLRITVTVSGLLATALLITRRMMPEPSDEESLDVICALFVSLGGTELEKQRARTWLKIKAAKFENIAPPGTSASTPQPDSAGRRADASPPGPAPVSAETAAAGGTASGSRVPAPNFTPRRPKPKRNRRRRHH